MTKILIAFLLAILVIAVYAKTGEAQQERATIQMVAATHRVETEHLPFGRKGDTEWLRWILRDRFGRTIGQGVFDCSWHKRLERFCIGEIHLPLGKLTAAGTSQTRSLGAWAVTGGTGRYRAAGGELRFVATSPNRLTIIIEI